MSVSNLSQNNQQSFAVQQSGPHFIADQDRHPMAPATRPLLKTRKFSMYHIQLFELILMGKTNRHINRMYGYTQKSHAVVDLSRKVMYKLLAYEGLCRHQHHHQIVYPRSYRFWWNNLLFKHYQRLEALAITPSFYNN